MACAGATFLGLKLQIAVPEAIVVGCKCSYEGHEPDQSKVSAILNQPIPETLTQLRSFLGTCGIARAWIEDFSELTAPLVHLTKKGVPFEITPECICAMEALKEKVSSGPALMPIDYQSGRQVILAVDSSYITVGWVLMQLDAENK